MVQSPFGSESSWSIITRIIRRQTVAVFLSPGTIATHLRARNESWPKTKRKFVESDFFGVFDFHGQPGFEE